MSRLQAACALALFAAAILWAGLWPFDFARSNRVSWITPGPGLRFDGGGLAWSVDRLDWDRGSDAPGFAVEVWFRADAVRGREHRTLLTLLDRWSTPLMGVRQQGGDLVVWDLVTNPGGDRWFNDFVLDDVPRPGELHHLAVTSDGAAPAFYVDGRAVLPSHGAPIPFVRPGERFAGRLVIGAMPPWRGPWSGDLLGLVLHDRALGADELRRDAERSPASVVASIAGAAGVVAAYAFDEGSGTRVGDLGAGGRALEVPTYFRPPDPEILALPRPRDWTAGWLLQDALLNLLGFVPLGFLLVLVTRVRAGVRPRASIVGAAAVGGAISLAIELSQVLMASRSSSLLDLLLNTAGTAVGAWVAVRRRGGG